MFGEVFNGLRRPGFSPISNTLFPMSEEKTPYTTWQCHRVRTQKQAFLKEPLKRRQTLCVLPLAVQNMGERKVSSLVGIMCLN